MNNQKRFWLSFALIGLILAGISGWLVSEAQAHGGAAMLEERWQAAARLFVVDNGQSEIVAIDLPDGQVVARIDVAPKTMIMGATLDGAYVLAARGRDVDRQHLTVIASGVEADGMHRPYVAKTLLPGNSIGGFHGSHVGVLWDKYAMTIESQGKLLLFTAEELNGAHAFTPEVIELGKPDHFDLMQKGEDTVWVGALRSGSVRLIDRQGGEQAVYSCPAFHGMGSIDDDAFFACANDVLVVRSDGAEERIRYPGAERIGAFLNAGGVLWGTSEGVQNLQRLDPATMELTLVPLESTLYARATDEAEESLLLFLQNGELEVRKGNDGALVNSVAVTPPLPEMDEDVSGAIMPAIQVWGDKAYISIPNRGMIAEVNWREGRLLRNLRVGGMPTRMTLVEAFSQQDE